MIGYARTRSIIGFDEFISGDLLKGKGWPMTANKKTAGKKTPKKVPKKDEGKTHKKCPICAAHIEAEAIKCLYCGSELNRIL